VYTKYKAKTQNNKHKKDIIKHKSSKQKPTKRSK